MALHQGNTRGSGRSSASTLRALGRANAATQSGPAEFWSGRLEQRVAGRSRRGTAFSQSAFFEIDEAPVRIVDFVPAEEDTSGW